MRKWAYFVGKKHVGNMGDVMTTGILVLALMMGMLGFLHCMELIQKKERLDELTRQYLLAMETEGFLVPEKQEKLLTELVSIGITQPDLSGTTFLRVGYGEPIELVISGKLEGVYEIHKIRTSTAKY